MVHDSDIFMYLLFDKGKLVDQFDSKPDYFGPVSKEQHVEWAGHVKRIVKYAAPGATTEAIQKCLKRRQIVEDDRAGEFAALMGIDADRARLGFKYAQETKNDFEMVNGKGYSALEAKLTEAVRKRDVTIVREILAKGASPNQTDELGVPQIVSAVRSRSMEVIETLVAAGADVLQQAKYGGDALWLASADGHNRVVELILSKAKGDARLSKSMDVGLRSAVLAGHWETVQLLLDAGADVNGRDEGGQTALMLASIHGVEGAYEMHSKQKFPQRDDQPKADWPKLVKILLRAGADPNLQTNDGLSALMAATARGHEDICRLLVENGADVNLKEKSGMTALAIAQATKHQAIEEMLRAASDGSKEGRGEK